MLLVIGEPLPVFLVDTHAHLLETENRLQGFVDKEELVKVLFVDHLIRLVAGLALSGIDQEVWLGVLVLDVGREPRAPCAYNADLAHDLDSLFLTQGLGLCEATLLPLDHLCHKPLLPYQ